MPKEAKWAISFLAGFALIYIGWQWQPLLVSLHVLICVTLILVVLLQSGKAADLAGAFGGAGSQTAFGPRGAATFLSHATTWCAVMFMLVSLTLVVRQTSFGRGSSGSILEGTAPAAAPAPAQTPPAGQTPAPTGQAPAPTGQQTPAQPAKTPAEQPAKTPAQPAKNPPAKK